jgi:hypothetical protein
MKQSRAGEREKSVWTPASEFQTKPSVSAKQRMASAGSAVSKIKIYTAVEKRKATVELNSFACDSRFVARRRFARH